MNSINRIKGQLFRLGTWLNQNPNQIKFFTTALTAGLLIAGGTGIVSTMYGPMPGGGDGLT